MHKKLLIAFCLANFCSTAFAEVLPPECIDAPEVMKRLEAQQEQVGAQQPLIIPLCSGTVTFTSAAGDCSGKTGDDLARCKNAICQEAKSFLKLCPTPIDCPKTDPKIKYSQCKLTSQVDPECTYKGDGFYIATAARSCAYSGCAPSAAGIKYIF